MFSTWFLLFYYLLVTTAEHREHKVHNIVLYPDKHSWCKTTPIKQVISVPGYETVTINNNVCVGACFSYSIPFAKPAEPGEIIGPYCDSCQPIDTKCYHVMLKSEKDVSRNLRKDIQLISTCNCTRCSLTPTPDCGEGAPELPIHFIASKPQDVATNQTNGEDELLNLTQEKTAKYILKRLHWKKDWVLSDGNLSIKILEKIDLDQKKLNEFLKSVAKKHDDPSDHSVHYVNQQIQDYFKTETGHLVKGPHGSLVMFKDEKNPEIHLDSKLLKPNQAGVVISYDNHVKDHDNH